MHKRCPCQNLYVKARVATEKLFLTNAKKVTVSVLYWYEKLAGHPVIFEKTPKGVNFFSDCGRKLRRKKWSTTLEVPESSLTSVLIKPVVA